MAMGEPRGVMPGVPWRLEMPDIGPGTAPQAPRAPRLDVLLHRARGGGSTRAAECDGEPIMAGARQRCRVPLAALTHRVFDHRRGSILQERSRHAAEAGHGRLVERPLAAPVVYDDSSGTTDLTITKSEGTRVNLSAPLSVGGGHFLHWQFDGSVSFGDGQRDVALTLLRPGTVTAVYLNDKSKEPRHEPRCDCLEKCCESDEHQ